MKIATSILNSSDRIESVLKLNRTNTSYIHVDVMDGKFVEDNQFSIKEIKAVNLVTKYPMDVHLMVNDPLKYIEELSNLNIGYVTFHLEIKKDKKKIISKIKELGYKVGISIKPNTDLNELIPYFSDIDMVLVMSVEPGKGGQKFLANTVKRIKELKKMIVDGGYNIEIEVDGGINDTTITMLEDVDIAVVGSYIVKSDNYYGRIEKLLEIYDQKNLRLDSRYIKIGRILSNILILIGFVLVLVAFYLGNFDLLFFTLAPKLIIFGVGLLGLGFIIKSVCVINLNRIKRLSNK